MNENLNTRGKQMTNNKTKNLTFGEALSKLKSGGKVCLPYWNEDVFLSLQKPDKHSKMTHPYIYVTSRFGLVPWVATQIEILSEKWTFFGDDPVEL